MRHDYSGKVRLTVTGVKPRIWSQPKSVTVKKGKTATFTVKAFGAGMKYQWYYSTNKGKTWKKYSGKTSAALKVKGSTKNKGYYYRCIVKNTNGSVTSSKAKLTVK